MSTKAAYSEMRTNFSGGIDSMQVFMRNLPETR
jgi:hypothetical protein